MSARRPARLRAALGWNQTWNGALKFRLIRTLRAEDGWIGYGDWLGTGRVADRVREYRPFKQARAVVRRLRSKSESGMERLLQLGKKPDDIPTDPSQTYAKDGWTGYGD